MKPFSCLKITTKVILSICAVVFVVLTFGKNQAFAVSDGIYKRINFQGKLTNLNGTNVADGNYSVIFTLYDASSAGTNLWDETQTVAVADGIFRVELGTIDTTISNVNFNRDTLYLGIKVGSDSEMTPRVRFTAVPYAFNSEKVNGLTVVNTSGNPFASTTTFRIGDGKTVSINNSLTFSGTDATTITFPNANDTVVVLDLAQTMTNKTIGSTGLTFSGATTDVTTGTNEDFVLIPNGTGKIGLNTTSPLATFDLRYKSGTLAVASISGITSFATLALDNFGTGDLFVASKSGFNRFVIRNDGNVGINKALPTEALDVAGNITVSGGVFKANGSAGVSGTNSCLTTVGGIVTTIAGSCGGGAGGGSNWGEAGGLIYPGNVTETLSIGGAATSSAKFLVYAVNSGSNGNTIVAGTASTAGALTFSGSSPILNFLNGNNFNVQSSVGGDAGVLSRLFISGNTGNVGIGTTTPTGARLQLVGTGTNTLFELANGVQTTDFTTNQIGNLLITPSGGNATVSGSLQITNYATVAASLGIGNVTAPLGNGIINVSSGYQVRGTAGVSGSNSCLTTTGGIVTTIAGTCGGSSASPFSEIASLGLTVQSNITEDLLIGATATTSAKFGFLNLAGGTPTATTAGNLIVMPWTNGASQVGGNVGIGTINPTDKLVIAGGSLVLSSSTNQGIRGGGLTDCSTTGNRLTWNGTTNQFGCSTDKPYLTVRKSIDETLSANITPQDDDELKFSIGANETWTAQFVIQQNSGTVPDFKFGVTAPVGATCDVSINDTISSTNSVSNLGCGVSQAVTGNAADEVTFVYATIVNGSTAGTVTLQWSQNTSDPGNTTVQAGSTVVATNISGANLVNMSVVPDWTASGGTLFPRLATSMDLLIGGNSTASAKFAFINVGSGTPTASISGNLALSVPTGANPATQLTLLNGGNFNILSSVGGDTGATSRLFINGNTGNVGIGTTAPLEKLDITGNATMSGNLTLNSAASIQTTKNQSLTIGGSTTGNISLQANNSGTGKVQVGTGNGGTTTPDLFGLDVKSDTGDPTGFEGAMYYNTNTNKFRCYEGTAWTDCITAAGGGVAPDTAVFVDTVPAAWADNNTTELFNDATKPNITTDSTTATVLVSVHIRGTASNTANDAFLAARIVYTNDQTNPSCSTSTQVGEVMIGGFTTATTHPWQVSGTFLHTPSTVAEEIRYTVCTSTESTGTATDTPEDVRVTLVELGADLAENYYTRDDTIGPGDVVTIDASLPAGVKKTSKSYDGKALGIVSTAPGITLDDAIGLGQGRAVPVALAGRIPVKVTTENGRIQIGDLLTSSSTPGVAMKATKAGQIIGQAMTPFNEEGVGRVLVFVKTDYWAGGAITDLIYSATSSAQIQGKDILSYMLSQKDNGIDVRALSDIVTDRVAAGFEVITPKVITQEVSLESMRAYEGKDIVLNLSTDGSFIVKDESGKGAIRFDSKGNATFAGVITADKIRANSIEGLEFSIRNEVLSLKDILGADFASFSAALDKGQDGLTLALSQDLGKTISSEPEGAIEKFLSFSKGLQVRNLFESLDQAIFRGVVEFLGQVIFRNDVGFEREVAFNNDTGGYAHIRKGQKFVDVGFEKEYKNQPVINVSPTIFKLTDETFRIKVEEGLCTQLEGIEVCQDKVADTLFAGDIKFVVQNQTTQGFLIVLNQQALSDITFSWQATAVKEVKTFSNDGPSDLSLPFEGDYQPSNKFGEHSNDPKIKDKDLRLGMKGHDGLDIAVPVGTPVLSVDDGEVEAENNGYGLTLVIKHRWGKTTYGHLSERLVQEGDKVVKGQKIASSGNTGLSTGPHLHFGIKLNNSKQDNGYAGFENPWHFLSFTKPEPNKNVAGVSTQSASLSPTITPAGQSPPGIVNPSPIPSSLSEGLTLE